MSMFFSNIVVLRRLAEFVNEFLMQYRNPRYEDGDCSLQSSV